MIRGILVLGAIGIFVGILIWQRSQGAHIRQILFSIYNKALAKEKKSILGVPVSLLDVIDETDLSPNRVHSVCRKLEERDILKVTQQTVKLTMYGVAHFKLKYMSNVRKVKNA